MGWMDEYELALKQKLTGESSGGVSSGGSSSSSSSIARQLQSKTNSARKANSARKTFNSWIEEYNRTLQELQIKNILNVSSGKYVPTPEEIVKGTHTNNDEEEERTWFQKGLFEDGYDFGDVTRTILGTIGDVTEDLATGILGLGEKGIDTLAYLAPYMIRGTQTGTFNPDVAQKYDDMYNQAKNDAAEFVARDLYDEEAVAAWLVGNQVQGMTGFDVEEASILGAKSDALVQSAGQLAAQYGLQSVGVPWFVTSGVSTFGSEAENALNSGATYGEAGLSAAISAGAEILSEKLFGGDIFTSSSGSDLATTFLTRSIADKGWRTFAKLGIDGLGEGAEEVFSQFMSNLGSALYREEDLGEILFSEQAMDEYLESFIGGWVLGEAMGGINVYKSGKAGRDFTSGMTDSEKSVVDKLFQDRLAEAEKDGGKLSAWKKNKLYESVIRDMDRGYISTDTIEEVLGGESYRNYKKLLQSDNDLLAEYDSLGAKKDATLQEQSRYAELTPKVKGIMEWRNKVKSQLGEDVYGLVKGTRLVESYNERSRRGEVFQADLTKYEPKQRAIVQRAIDSGILNNSNRTHDFVDVVARISADKGVLFDFTNNDKLKESGFAIDGATVDGYVTESGISINIDSPKAWQSTVGHEITHVLEGTDLYTELQQMLFSYADSKGVLSNRRSSIQSRYKNIKGANFDAELTADLVGEYLFTDEDFVRNLSANHRNIFQKIYDEIKYLGRIVTAGSKQARDLERVKRAFDKAYREGGKAQGETKYSISDSTGKQLTAEQQEYFKNSKMRDENGNLKVMYHGSPVAGFHEFSPQFSDDGTSFFFVDSNRVAQSYSGTNEKYQAKTFRTADDFKQFFADIGATEYDVVEENGKFKLLEFGDEIASSDDAKGLYEEFRDWSGLGEGSANYEVYLNLTNPLEVDADGRDWNMLPSPGKAEVYEYIKVVDVGDSPGEVTIEYAVKGDETPITVTVDLWEKFDDSIADMLGDLAPGESIEDVPVSPATTRDYSIYAKANGYDGVIFNNIYDIGGYGNGGASEATVAIAFDSNQIKSVANANPTADPDIRYSVSDHGMTTETEVQFSLSNDTAYMDKAIAMNQSSMRVDSDALAETKALRERIATRMNDIKDRGLVGLPEDIEGNTAIANSSYDVTEENTTICPRSLAAEAFVDAVSEYLGRPLTVNEQIYISQDLQGRSLTPECTYCYVATDRKAYRAFLGEYVSQRDAVLQKIKDNPNADVSRSGVLYREFLNGRKDTNPMYNRFKMWVEAYKTGKPMIDASHLANINKLMGDISSEFGADLRPQIVDAMKYAQSASWAKKRVNYVAYNGHILNWKQDRINKLNSHYGLRMYSFSDFHPAFVLENMQMITDASVRGLKMLGYTKDTDFVDIFAPSGMNINISTFGFEAGGEVFENNLIGAEWEKAKELREQHPNVGITFVATNDTLVNWALAQDWIDVVIPYHLVRTGAEVAKAFNYTNYTSESSDAKTKDWKKGDKKYIAPTEHNNDKATYLTALKENHLKPRFERFLDNPNYMKLVNECRQPASESKPVQPVFNEDAAMVALAKLEANGYYQPIGGSVDRMYEIAGEVAEAMTNQFAPAMSLSNADEQHTPDSLSALRLEAPVRNTDADLIPYTEYIPETDADKIPYTEHLRTGDGIAPVARARDEAKAPNGDGANSAQSDSRNGTRKDLHRSIIDGIKTAFKAKGLDFDAVLKNAKNLSTWSTVDNTPQRVLEKALGYKEGGILADITVNTAAQNESKGIRWLNSFTDRKNGVLAQISKQYHIKPGSKKSAAAQMYAEGFFVDDNNNIVKYGDRELAIDFPNPKDQANIKGLARDPRIRRIYDETLAMINASRARNLYPEIPRLDNYFLHFRAMQDTFSTLGLPFNPNDIRAKDLPTDLNGVTADLKPGQPFFASAMHRTGKRTSFDLLGGLERYLSSAKNQIYHIDDIQTLRALRNYIAETYGQATGLENLDSLTDAEAEERIKQVYGSHLSTFAKFLNEEANVLAGKTALIDRGLEGIIGRRGITFLNTLNQQVGSNMVGYNVSSSLTNFLPVAQTFAKTNKFDFVKAFAQTALNKFSGGRFDSFAEDSPVVIRRKGEDRFYRTPWQKLADPGYALMGAVDDISTELIARTKYNELTRKGMDSQRAHFETDKWVSRLMGDRSLGQQPQLYNSKMLGLVTKFQLEVRNQLDAQFYDTIQEKKASNEDIQNGLLRNAKTAAQVTSTFVQLAVAQHLFGKAFESVAGYNPAFDIIEVLMTAFGFDDEEESEDTVLDNLGQALLELAEDMPYASIFLDGGRVPVSEAIPDLGAIMRGEDEYGNDIGVWNALWEEAQDIAPYYFMPGGYGQFKKTKAGLEMFSDEHPIAGSYTEAGNLRFPVEDTFANRLKAGIFGQYANDNARTYFDEERRTLNPDQTAIVAGLGIPIEEYWDHLDNLYAFYDEKDRLKEAAEAEDATAEDVLRSRYVSSIYSEIYDLYDKQREIANGNSPTKQAELREIQRQIADLIDQSKNGMNDIFVSGAYAEIGGRRFNQDAESGQWYEITPTKANGKPNYYYEQEQKITQGFGISYEEYWNNRDTYDDAYWFATSYGKNLLDTAKHVYGGADFARYAGALSNIKADKDENGKSINGSKKAKVLAYCNLMSGADYGQRIILFKSQYPSDDTYNYDIIDYLNGRSDISYDEMKAILIELGFDVDGEGNITW